MKTWLSIVTEAAALLLIAAGAGLVAIPAGVIAAGVALLWIAHRVDPGERQKRTGDLR